MRFFPPQTTRNANLFAGDGDSPNTVEIQHRRTAVSLVPVREACDRLLLYHNKGTSPSVPSIGKQSIPH